MSRRMPLALVFLAGMLVVLAGCVPSQAAPLAPAPAAPTLAPTAVAPAPAAPAPTVAPDVSATSLPDPTAIPTYPAMVATTAPIDPPAVTTNPALAPAPTTATAAAAASGAIHLTLVASGSQARYRVREQLAGRSFPSDAIGTTSDVQGTLVIQPDGTIPAGSSQFTVNLTTLKSDESRRDRFIQQNTLETATYPTATFVPAAVSGLASPLPRSGDVSFQLTGNLTIHGVTRPATWQATAHIAGSEMQGTATTSFKFEDYGMTPPKVMVVLSVEDSISLEMDFHLVQG